MPRAWAALAGLPGKQQLEIYIRTRTLNRSFISVWVNPFRPGQSAVDRDVRGSYVIDQVSLSYDNIKNPLY